MRLRFVVAVFGSVLFATGAYAGTAAFNVSGTVIDGSTISGTVTIDTTAGAVTAANETVSGAGSDSGNYTALFPGLGSGLPYEYSVPVSLTGHPNTLPQTNILVAATTLVGYNGGNLFSSAKH